MSDEVAKESVSKESPKPFWLELFEFSFFHTSVVRNFETEETCDCIRAFGESRLCQSLSDLTQFVFPYILIVKL